MSAATFSEPQIIGSILIGADELVAELVASRIPHMAGRLFFNYHALGVIRNGQLIGGVVYHNYRGHDIDIGVAFDRPGWALPGTMRALFSYPFNELNCIRITAITGKKNKLARSMLERSGFKQEGSHPKGLDGVKDALSYGLLREDCVWIKDRAHAKFTATTARAA